MQANDSTKSERKQAQPCPTCGGKGYTRLVWYDENGGAPWVLRPACPDCQERRQAEER